MWNIKIWLGMRMIVIKSKMRVLVLVLSICWCLGEDKLEHKGMMLSYTKEYLAYDLFELATNILRNTRAFNFSSIIQEDDYGSFKLISHLYDIRVTELENSLEDIATSAVYSHTDRKFTIKSEKNVTRYTISFAWRLTALDMTLGHGTGRANATSSFFSMSATLPGAASGGELTVDFAFSAPDIEGVGVTAAVRKWVSEQLSSNCFKELSNVIAANSKGYIKKHFLSSFKKAQSFANEKHLQFTNKPLDTKLAHDRLWISFQTEVRTSEGQTYLLENSCGLSNPEPRTGLALYLAPEHILAALQLSCANKQIEVEFDPSEYTGTIKDFFAAMPELFVKYSPDTPVNSLCRLQSLQLNSTTGRTDAVLHCSFAAAKDAFLQAEVKSAFRLVPRVIKDSALFLGLVQEGNLEAVSARPSTVAVSLFVSQLFLRSTKKLVNAALEVPKIMYEHGNDLIEAVNDAEHYVAYYYPIE